VRFAVRAGRCGVAVLLALVTSVAVTSQPAAAHQPVILDEDDDSPERGPELVDGTVSFAVYGSITKPGALRGLTFNLKVGDPIVVDLLIPNLEPELSSPLPSITVLDPDGNPTDPPVAMGEVFDESFSRTSYRYLAKLRSSATKAGRYGVVVGSATTGRFVIGVGDREVRGEVRQDDAKGSLASWYAAPVPIATTIAPSQPATSAPAATTAQATTSPPTATTATEVSSIPLATTTPPSPSPTSAVAVTAAAKQTSDHGRGPWLILIPIAALIALAFAARRRPPKEPT
jgi:hypothetical protein